MQKWNDALTELWNMNTSGTCSTCQLLSWQLFSTITSDNIKYFSHDSEYICLYWPCTACLNTNIQSLRTEQPLWSYIYWKEGCGCYDSNSCAQVWCSSLPFPGRAADGQHLQEHSTTRDDGGRVNAPVRGKRRYREHELVQEWSHVRQSAVCNLWEHGLSWCPRLASHRVPVQEASAEQRTERSARAKKHYTISFVVLSIQDLN